MAPSARQGDYESTDGPPRAGHHILDPRRGDSAAKSGQRDVVLADTAMLRGRRPATGGVRARAVWNGIDLAR
jgi:hypothetical protein